MEIKICVGSSCHLKGSYDILKRLEQLIKDNNLEEKVVLKASFCLGNCTNGVSMQVDGELVDNANVNTIDGIFNTKINV